MCTSDIFVNLIEKIDTLTFLSSRRQCVQVNGSCSSRETVVPGIPQGTVLRPTLFLLFICDLPECLVNECALFADDTSAYGVGKDSSQLCSTLSLDIKAASNWAKTWAMLFNAEKSEQLSITGKAQNSTSGRKDMETTKLPKLTTRKHLGISVNSTLSWTGHIKSVYISCARKIGMLKRLKRKLHPSAFKRIYRGAIRPKMEHACTEWSGRPTSKLVDLQRIFCRHHNIQLPSLQKKRFDHVALTLFFKVRLHQATNSEHCTSFCLPFILFGKSPTLFQQLTGS